MGSILEEISGACSHPDKLRVRNKERVESILQEIVSEGPPALQIITDFDHTLTKFKSPEGLRCETCHGILDHSPLVPDEFRQKSKILFEKYYPIEVDHNMTIDEKIPLMIEWYEKSHELLASFRIAKSDIKEMVAKSQAHLRDGSKEVLQKLNAMGVPVLVFSAGIGDILEEVLIREDAFLPNLRVVSNYIEFDDSGRIKAFKRPLIHMFNKNETALDHGSYFDELKERVNALVLGDSVGDVGMDKGMPRAHAGVSLKIGFLNDKIDDRMESFLQNFDIVLVDDQSFEFVDLILQRLEKKQ